jgi:hypothetical protein
MRILWVSLITLPAARAAAADDPEIAVGNVTEAAEQISETVLRILQENNVAKELNVREFRVAKGGNNAELPRLIGNRLTASGVQVGVDTENELEGRFEAFRNVDFISGFRGQCTLRMGERTRNFSFEVNNPDEGEVFSGSGGEIAAPPSEPHGTQPDTSGVVVEGTRILPRADSPWAVEVLRKQNGRYLPLIPVRQKDRPRVEVGKGDILAVRIHNQTDFQMVADVLVDGLSRFAVATDPRHRTGLLDLIPPRATREIMGFYKDRNNVAEFTVGKYTDGPAARILPDASERATLTVVFRAAWNGPKPPPNEPPGGPKDIGINEGELRNDATRIVKVDHIGRVRAVISIVYDLRK